MLAREYGIVCKLPGEKSLAKNVNAFLASFGYRKMYKSARHGARNPGSSEPEPR
jgi:hypothetical protein